MTPHPTASSIADILGASNATSRALVSQRGEVMTYGSLQAQVERLAGQLTAAGVEQGNTVAMLLGNGPEAATVFLAAASVAAAAPLDPRQRPDEIRRTLDALRPRAIIVRQGPGETLAWAPRHLGAEVLHLTGTLGSLSLDRPSKPVPPREPAYQPAESDALILHTSGTTGMPKQVVHPGAALTRSALTIAATLGLDESDTGLNVMPLFHIHGLVGSLLASIAAGAAIGFLPRFGAHRFFEAADRMRATWYTAVPSIHQAVIRYADGAGPLPRFRFARSSSAPLATDTLVELESILDAPVIEAYGMTEAAHQICSNPLPPGERKRGSVGLPTGADIAICDTEGRRLPTGASGELLITGPTVITAYGGADPGNDVAFVDGWLRTGDQGRLDTDGYLYLTGRFKEMINRAGEKISPVEIDEALLSHPAVAAAIAFPVPNSLLGEEPGAAAVVHEGSSVTVEELRRHIRSRLSASKVPRVVVLVDSIPLGSTGKPRRGEMAERLGLG